MKMTGLITAAFLMLCFQSQAQTDHPFNYEVNTDNVLRNMELFVFSHQPGQVLNSTIGSYTPQPSEKTFLSMGTDYLHQPAYTPTGKRNLNVLTLDIDGDLFDDVVEAHEYTDGFILGAPFINRSALTITSVPIDSIQTGALGVTVKNPMIKMDKGDFNNDGNEEFVLAYNDHNSGMLVIEIRSVNPLTHQMILLAKTSIDTFYTVQNGFEAFDITVGDFNGDNLADIAVSGLEETTGSPGLMSVYIRSLDVTTGPIAPNSWSINPGGKITQSTAGMAGQLTDIEITSAMLDTSGGGHDNIAVALVHTSPVTSFELIRSLSIHKADPGAGGLNNLTANLSVWRDTITIAAGYFPALAVVGGDLNHDYFDELAIAYSNDLFVFGLDSNNQIEWKAGVTPSGTVHSNSYQVSGNGSFLSIGDVDFDYINELVMISYPITGGPFGGGYVAYASVWESNLALDQLTNTGYKGIGIPSASDASTRYAVTLGEIRGGTYKLLEPVHYIRKTLKPIVINNTPPHHFDILDTVVADITNCFPNFSCNMNSEYKEVNTTSSTLTTQMKSDWAISAEVAGLVTVYGVPMQGSISGYYGEEFSNTSLSQSTVEISTVSIAKGDDQIFATVQDYNVFEYPLDSNGVVIGHIITVSPAGIPIIQWMDSKSTDAIGYYPTHEVGNLLSYPSLANFDTYVGNDQTIKEMGVGYNVGTGGSLSFGMTFTDFQSNNADSTKKYGLEASAEIGDVDKLGIGIKVEGKYNASELTSHISEAKSEISYNSNLTTSLNPAFNDANYTITPKVYWGANGAITLGYAVNPSIPSGGLNNFWTKYYSSNPDLTLILPWKYDPEKGYSLSSPEVRRLSKSIKISKPTYQVGDTVKVVAFIHNYSFVDYMGPVEFQFYSGAPDQNGILLSDINGQTLITVNDTFPARGRTRVEFDWFTSVSSGNTKGIYVVIDPNNLITEVHEDNNIGFYPIGNSAGVGIDEASTTRTFNFELYPNPTRNGNFQVNFTLPHNGMVEVNLFDLQGRKLENLYQYDLKRGNYILPLSISDYPSGVYLVGLEQNGIRRTLKLMIE